MFIEFKKADNTGTFVLNAFQIVSIHETTGGTAGIVTIHDKIFITSETYKNVIEKLNTI